MIDTIKLGIPITQHQHTKLLKLLADDAAWQWVQFQRSTGELRLMRCKGLAHLDQQSFHRKILWDIPDLFSEGETFLVLELSLPKFWCGHNIHLLYGLVEPLEELKRLLEKQLHLRLPDVLQWQVFRVDICYAWRCPSQAIAQQVLDSLKRLHYPRKKPIIYPTSVVFAGATYSFKFYLKLPEFLNHDRKALLESDASLVWIDYLEKIANGVLRCEATLRRKYLQRKNIKTVKDLVQSTISVQLDEQLIENHSEDLDSPTLGLEALLVIIQIYYLKSIGVKTEVISLLRSVQGKESKVTTIDFKPGTKYHAPAHKASLSGVTIDFKGGGYTVVEKSTPLSILQYFLQKFLGDQRGMQPADEVKAKLLEKYKPSKAIRLLGFWLHARKFGLQDAKVLYSDRAFYRNKAELKEAGVSLVESSRVVELDKDFIESFKLEAPSSHVTNVVDNFRDSENVLNIADYQNQPDRKPGRKS